MNPLPHRRDLPPAARARHTIDRLFRATIAPAGHPTGTASTVGQVLDRRVDVVWQAHVDGHPAAAELLRATGGAPRAGQAGGDGLTRDDMRAAIAREHGFVDWAAIDAHRERPVEPSFEAAVDAIVSGDVDALRALLGAHPALVRARSPFGHRAALVHYVAANGVETSRQWQSPRNAVDVLGVLLRHGADPDAVAACYTGGSGQTPLCLLASSSHPAEAGVQAGLVEELCRGGARPDGLDDDGLPLWTAITFGYPQAVDALARCGARVDNLVFAAAVGDLSKLSGFLGAGGEFIGGPARSGRRVGVNGPQLNPDHLIEYALIYSAGLGRRAVVELLLTRRPDLGVREPVFHSTAVGSARYHRRADVLALLEAA